MSSTASTNSEEVKMLVSMGFPEQQAKIALLRANNEVNRAVELLSAGCEYKLRLICCLQDYGSNYEGHGVVSL